MLEQVVGEGSVLLIATGGYDGGAVLGGFVAYSLQRGGCRGIITDGAIRDVDEIRSLGIPCFSRTVTPVNGARRWRMTDFDLPICLPGQGGGTVSVVPGDLVLADSDGVVVVPAAAARIVIEDAEKLASIEKSIGKALRTGSSRQDSFQRNPRFDHIRSVTTPDSPNTDE